MTYWRRGARTPGWWASLVIGALIVMAYVGGRYHVGVLDAKAAYFAMTMTVGMSVGLWVWAWRPQTRMGPLMFWWPALWLAGELPSAFPDSRVASTTASCSRRTRPASAPTVSILLSRRLG